MLAEAKQARVEARQEKVKSLMSEVVALIEQRQDWIKARQNQIKTLETIQDELVKGYDEDSLSEKALMKIRFTLRCMNASPRERMEAMRNHRDECDNE